MIDPWMIVTGVVVIVIFIISAIRGMRRAKALKRWAAANGWKYETYGDHLAESAPEVEPFHRGRMRSWYNVLTGRIGGRPARIYDYDYSTGSSASHSDSSEEKEFAIAHVRTKQRSPGLSIRKEKLHHKLFDAIGGEDIDFESDAFSRRFWVKSEDRAFAYHVITPRMMEFLMDHDDVVWQWKGRDLVLVMEGDLTVQRIKRFIGLLEGWLKRLPRRRPQT